MPVVGIVAEYNPLHHGHVHHIQTSRRMTGAEAVIAVMSGNFTQRGEPALVSKWARAEMALLAGVDLVFELPFVFAARSAYHFARGAVTLLQKTGVVTHLSFGSEWGEIEPLQKIAAVISQEPPEYREQLKRELALGHSYPQARAQALQKHLKAKGWRQDLSEMLALPNNILALEYLRVLQENPCGIIPVTIPRIGQGYHQAGNVPLASATFIRHQIQQQYPLDEIKGLPAFSRSVLEREISNGHGPVLPASMTGMIRFALHRMKTSELAKIHDIGEGLENRVHRAAQVCTSREQMIEHIKTRRYSYTRISRILLYSLLGFTREKSVSFDQTGPLYLRLLAFSPQGQKILHDMRVNSRLPVITKLGRRHQLDDPLAQDMLAFDLLATDLHSLLQPQPGPLGLDFLRSPVGRHSTSGPQKSEQI